MATVKELKAIIDKLTERVETLEANSYVMDVLMAAARADGYREGRESVLGSGSQPKVPRQRRLNSV